MQTRPVPSQFVGVNLAGAPLFRGMVNDDAQFKLMVASGVESIRIPFSWSAAQPYKNWLEVPPDQLNKFESGVRGVPTNFSLTDQIVATAARHGITVLPTVLSAPQWDAKPRKHWLPTPAHPQGYADYLTTLVDRYGPHGVFWAHNPGIPKLPIRMWQVWNEENLPYSWPRPFAKTYVTLLRASHDAIKAADPGAKVVLGALSDYSWLDLKHIERVPGARRLFDVIAVNNFAPTVGQAIFYLGLVRKAADVSGDAGKPMLATELSWLSGKGKTPQRWGWITTEAGQARNIAALLPQLALARVRLRLAGFYYFNWMGVERRGAKAFSFAGLLRFDTHSGRVVAKPALGAFRHAALTIEGCRRKGNVATRCRQR